MTGNRTMPPAPPVAPAVVSTAPQEHANVKAVNADAEVKKLAESKRSKIVSLEQQFKDLKDSLPEGEPINVVATRDGLYKRERKKVGDKFTIVDKDDLGTWMKPLKPEKKA